MIFGDVRFRGLPGQFLRKPNNGRDLCAFLLPRNRAGKHMGSSRKSAGLRSGSLTPGVRARSSAKQPREYGRRGCGMMRHFAAITDTASRSQAPSLIGAARRPHSPDCVQNSRRKEMARCARKRLIHYNKLCCYSITSSGRARPSKTETPERSLKTLAFLPSPQ